MNIYISAEDTEKGDGSLDKPFATIANALTSSHSLSTRLRLWLIKKLVGDDIGVIANMTCKYIAAGDLPVLKSNFVPRNSATAYIFDSTFHAIQLDDVTR